MNEVTNAAKLLGNSLIIACNNESIKIAKLLIDEGADVNFCNSEVSLFASACAELLARSPLHN